MILETVISVVVWIVLIVLAAMGLLGAVCAVVFFGPHFWLRADRGGEIGQGLLGMHDWCMPAVFIADHLAPALGIAAAPTEPGEASAG